MSEAVQIDENEKTGISRFYYSIADHNILLEIGIKTEIIEQQDTFPLPHAPAWCHGMISLRGKLIPVVNMHKVFNLSDESQSSWLLVLEKEPYPQLAIRIDKLPMQQQLQDESGKPLSDKTLPSWISSEISIDDKLLYEANHTEFFEQLILKNETSSSDLQEPQPTPNQDSSGNQA